MKEQVAAAYREWLAQQALYEVESMELHIARFFQWLYDEDLINFQPKVA